MQTKEHEQHSILFEHRLFLQVISPVCKSIKYTKTSVLNYSHLLDSPWLNEIKRALEPVTAQHQLPQKIGVTDILYIHQNPCITHLLSSIDNFTSNYITLHYSSKYVHQDCFKPYHLMSVF